jgi:hypothetical protein
MEEIYMMFFIWITLALLSAATLIRITAPEPVALKIREDEPGRQTARSRNSRSY